MDYWTKDLVVDPHDSAQNTWYVGVFSGWGGPPNGLGGLYKTTDRGQHWSRILVLDRVESCAISPTSSAEMYVTTETQGLWFTSTLSASTPAFSQVAGYPFEHPVRVLYEPVRVGARVGHILRLWGVPGNRRRPAGRGGFR